MTKTLKNLVIASTGVSLLAVAAATIASANIGKQAVTGNVDGARFVAETETTFPVPVAGVPLMVADAANGAVECMSETTVITRLNADRTQFGGETVRLAGGLEQAFADAWRREANLNPVTVSSVVAHVMSEDVVDVIEIDSMGCAMSRTLLSGNDWQALLVAAAGVEI